MRPYRKLLAALIASVILLLNFNVLCADGTGAAGAAGASDADAARIEQVHAFVERLYTNMMGRPSDPQGLDFWTNQLTSGNMSGNEVANKFYYSSEFKRIGGGMDDSAFVETMYKTLLGRSSDVQGLNHWVNQITSGNKTRDQIYRNFLASSEWKGICSSNGITPEYITIEGYINRLYVTVFGRDSDTNGRDFWSGKMRSGEYDAITTAHKFFFGSEYLGKNKSDSDYIKDLYMTLMGRDYDDAGLSFWLNKLSSGSTRLSVFNQFATSPEFTNICSIYGVTRGDAIPDRAQYTICIDPGHSAVMPAGNCPLGPGSSIGKPADAVGTHGSASGLMEYQLTLNISMQLKDELEARGYNVIMTRTDSSSAYDLVYRAQVANEGADLMVRIHADGLSDTSVTGCSAIIITPNNPWNPQTYSSSRSLADNLLSSYIAATGIRNRGVVEEDTMAGNNWSTVPCVLFELGFMTNRNEDLKMADPTFQVSMVSGLADGIDAYYGF